MTTVVAQIGNTDGRLSPQQWAEFITFFRATMRTNTQTHFFGYSEPDEPWQNCAAVGLCGVDHVLTLRRRLAALAKRYRQDSIALTIGDTEFVSAAS